jgi:hypothetical protein
VRDLVFNITNRLGRAVAGFGVTAMGRRERRKVDRQLASYARDQGQLRERYGIDPDTPIRTYDESVRAAVEAFAARNPDARFAYTSGSTNEPKKIAYTKRRIRNLVGGNVSVIARMLLRERIRSASLFILSGLKDDDSLSTLVLSDAGAQVKYLDGLLTPGKYLMDPRMAESLERYGPCATRLWALVLANSAIIYSTNPSTLALFLTDIHEDWQAATAMIRDYHREPEGFDSGVHGVRRRMCAPGWKQRFARIVDAGAPPPVEAYVPALRIYCCWDGGYVRPFLDQVEAFLPRDRYRLVPMYSMSTETIETLNYFDGDSVRFLPIGPDVYYEFLPDGAPDDPALLIGPMELEVGETYTMVVSDCYGLTRYQTEDLFVCQGNVRGVPDLRFLRRRGIKYSFTGEKVTGEQLTEGFARLRDRFPELRASGMQMTYIPSRPEDAVVPGYKLVLAHPGQERPDWIEPGQTDEIATAFDDILAAINSELAGKLESKRLGGSRVVVMPYDELAAGLDAKTRDADDANKRIYDSQFKLLPLYARLWEDFGFSGA